MTAPSWDVAAAWATVDDLVAPCQPGAGDDQALMADALLGASTILYNLTGKIWSGESTDVIRPTADHVVGATSWAPYPAWAGPGIEAGYYAWPGMWGSCGCNRVDVCGAWSISEITLPGWPVTAVDEVKIDGLVLDPAHYRLQGRRQLVFVAGVGELRQGWPCCQDVTLAATETNTWQITYKWGVAPPPFWKDLAALLGCQLYLSMAPGREKECRLPRRIQSLTRQGVTIAVIDNYDIFVRGLTGIPEIDMAISALRYGSDSSPRVVVPGKQPSFRRDG